MLGGLAAKLHQSLEPSGLGIRESKLLNLLNLLNTLANAFLRFSFGFLCFFHILAPEISGVPLFVFDLSYDGF